MPTQGAPRPAPRAASPDKQVRMSTTLSTTGQSYTSTGGQSYTSGTGTATGTGSGTYTSTTGSNQWDSDEESGSLSPTPRTPRNKQPQQQKHRVTYQDQEEEDSDWDDVSELDNIVDPSNIGRPTTANRPAAPVPIKGERVAHLTQSIEMQLAGRGGKKPVGGVNTVDMEEDDEEEDDDSLGSLTEEEEETPRPPKPVMRKTPVRASQQTDTENTSNTYGTSLWGSSKGKSRVSRASTAPGGSDDGSDWEYDDDNDLRAEDL